MVRISASLEQIKTEKREHRHPDRSKRTEQVAVTWPNILNLIANFIWTNYSRNCFSAIVVLKLLVSLREVKKEVLR